MQILEQIVNILVVGAIALTIFKSYLTANKIWSRKHKQVVSESVSVTAQLIGFATALPFMVKWAMDADYLSLANLTVKLALTMLFLFIGVGFWVRLEGRAGMWTKIKRAFRLEKEESLDLINALIRPAGARVILDALKQLALIDRELDEQERDFIQDFADGWNIEIDFRKEFETASEAPLEELYVKLRKRISEYLSRSPDRDQASQFLDIMNLLIHVDHKVSREEEFIVEEIKGMIRTYIEGGVAAVQYSVIVVPQDPEEVAAIRALLPNVTAQAEWGRNIYFAGKFHSRLYAEMISEKYQVLNLFSIVKTVRAPQQAIA